jgi:hypothetical protein
VALLVTAARLVESFRQLRMVDPGFQPARVTTARLTLPQSRYPDAAARVRFADAVLANLSQLPGVEATAIIDAVPIADNRQGTEFTRLDGPPADPAASPNANVAWITEGYSRRSAFRCSPDGPGSRHRGSRSVVISASSRAAGVR